MEIRLIKCQSCGAPVKVPDSSAATFSCGYCGHSGAIGVKDIYTADGGAEAGLLYDVDIVMVIDATASMRPFIDEVKSNALRFYGDLAQAMKSRRKQVAKLRVKVIGFRDFYEDGDDSIEMSRFFELPQDQPEFNQFVSGLHAKGGGDIPETGLEALVLAMRSAWTTGGAKRRHIIALWTDTSTHPLEKNLWRKPRNYPKDMPTNLNELTDMWESHSVLKPGTKRLILFGPEKYAWAEIAAHWNNTIHFPSPAGQGLNSVDYRTILDAITNSV